MKKVYVIPHTHWDLEWYFSNETSDILLQRLANDLMNNDVEKFTLDGQTHLFERMLKSSSRISEGINKLNLENKLDLGPLFSQQDMLNTSLATTQWNFEIGNIHTSANNKTVYMPDTFGFNEQLPQVFKLNGKENFVSWRGIKPEEKQYSNIYKWVGIDGSSVQASCMSEGYYAMGQYYPYNNEVELKEKFNTELIKYVERQDAKNEQNVLYVPLGGDQAPFEKDLNKYLIDINSKQSKYKFEIGSLQDYFDNLNVKNIPEISHQLYYSGTSKIHRTIHSNRIDIKQLFRKAELMLNNGLLPLEILYKENGGTLIDREYIINEIVKPLLKSAAHDSLGACNSDQTNKNILNRLERIIISIDSAINYMIRDLNKLLNVKNKLIIYNQMPFKKDIKTSFIISNSSNATLGSNDNSIIEIECINKTWDKNNEVYEHKMLIESNDVEPFGYKVIDLIESKPTTSNNTKNIFVSEKGISVKGKNIAFKIKKDAGDQFDFSSDGIDREYFPQKNEITKVISNQKLEVVFVKSIINYEGKNIEINSRFFITENSIDHYVEIDNNLSNVKCSIVFPETKKIVLSRHGAFVEQEKDNIVNWKEKGYRDKPVNSFVNDGLVSLDEINILTKGNNEVNIENSPEITLYRSVDYMGKPELLDRPGAVSGLPFKTKTPDALLHKELTFEFRYTFKNEKIVQDFNNWISHNIVSYTNQTNTTLQYMDRFIINEFESREDLVKPSSEKIDSNKIIIWRYMLEDKKTSSITSNPLNIKTENYLPYEIKI